MITSWPCYPAIKQQPNIYCIENITNANTSLLFLKQRSTSARLSPNPHRLLAALAIINSAFIDKLKLHMTIWVYIIIHSLFHFYIELIFALMCIQLDNCIDVPYALFILKYTLKIKIIFNSNCNVHYYVTLTCNFVIH